MFCKNCGVEVTTKFCPECGCKMEEVKKIETVKKSNREWIVAVMFDDEEYTAFDVLTSRETNGYYTKEEALADLKKSILKDIKNEDLDLSILPKASDYQNIKFIKKLAKKGCIITYEDIDIKVVDEEAKAEKLMNGNWPVLLIEKKGVYTCYCPAIGMETDGYTAKSRALKEIVEMIGNFLESDDFEAPKEEGITSSKYYKKLSKKADYNLSIVKVNVRR